MPILELSSKRLNSSGRMEIRGEKKPELYFYGDIISSSWEAWQEEDRCPQEVSDFLSALDGAEEIHMYFNSGGGSAFAGIAMYYLLKRNPARKIAHVDGLAASAATLPLFAADKVWVPKGAQIMIHDPQLSLAGGNAADLRACADHLDKLADSIAEIYAGRLNGEADVRELMREETWLTGTEAASLFSGFTAEDGTAVACMSAYFPGYRNAPAEQHEKEKLLTRIALL